MRQEFFYSLIPATNLLMFYTYNKTAFGHPSIILCFADQNQNIPCKGIKNPCTSIQCMDFYFLFLRVKAEVLFPVLSWHFCTQHVLLTKAPGLFRPPNGRLLILAASGINAPLSLSRRLSQNLQPHIDRAPVVWPNTTIGRRRGTSYPLSEMPSPAVRQYCTTDCGFRM